MRDAPPPSSGPIRYGVPPPPSPELANALGAKDEQNTQWLKVDLHIHTAEDPLDELDYSATELLLKAHSLGFYAIAITHHNAVFRRPEVEALALDLGLLLIPAGEIRIDGADVVILNITQEEASSLQTWDALADLRAARGDDIFTIAAHPFYFLGGSIGRKCLEERITLFDAIEQCHFHTRLLDLNSPALELADRFGKPIVATSDSHRLSHFGRHYTKVRGRPGDGPRELFTAIRAGQVECTSPPHSLWSFLEHAWWIFATHELRLLQARSTGQFSTIPAFKKGEPLTPRSGVSTSIPRLPEATFP